MAVGASVTMLGITGTRRADNAFMAAPSAVVTAAWRVARQSARVR